MGNCMAMPKTLDGRRGEDVQALKRSIIEGLAPAYRVSKLLGHGAEGNTWLVQDVHTGQSWAMKLIHLPLPTKIVQSLFREVKFQSQLGEGHPNIITPQEVVLTDGCVGLVMEYASAGNLTEYVTTKYKLCAGQGLLMPEDEARYFFRQLVSAVDYCHRRHVAHRDLKLDNALLSGHNPPHLKLCDFGFARGWAHDSNFNTVIGTPDYMSPQLTSAKSVERTSGEDQCLYDGCKSDVWAMGVLLCVMLIGRFPFDGDETVVSGDKDACAIKKVWLQQSKRAKWHDHHLLTDQLQYLSKEVRDLLDRMLETEESQRIGVQGIMAHPWFNLPMAPQYEATLARLQQEQDEAERKLAAGAHLSEQRDAAISNLITLAASDEFKRRAQEPITRNSTFQLWTRVNLRTVEGAYPSFNRQSLRACMNAHTQRTSLLEPGTPPLMDKPLKQPSRLATVDSSNSSLGAAGLATLQSDMRAVVTAC